MQSVREISTRDGGRPALENRTAWTIRKALDWATQYFRAGDVDSSRFEAEELLAHAIQVERLTLYLQPSRMLYENEMMRFQELVERRRSGIPSAYLVGKVDFMQAQIEVNRSVLIPRPETEELVEKIIFDYREQGFSKHHGLQLLDLGTGSGAIAIALLTEWPGARAVAVDLSLDALSVARENALKNGVADRVIFLQSDWMEAVTGLFDLIVSNPPYIPSDELSALPTDVLAHEPHLALDGGPGGTRAIEKILQNAPRFLRPGCPLYLEIGYNQREAIERLLAKTAGLERWQVFRDLADRDRIVRAFRSEQ